MNDTATRNTDASVITLAEDNTPFLSARLIGRPLWRVVLRDWSINVRVGSVSIDDPYSRVADVYLDPVSGRILKLKTRWPEGVPEMAPEVSAETGAEQMTRFGRTRYHDFPRKEPKVTFFQALESIPRLTGDNPAEAEQIVALYVMWSRMDKEPRAVWAIMLRGVPMQNPPPGFPPDVPDQYTYIIDAQTGKWIMTTNTPEPRRWEHQPE
ncbi:MAG: hypothetical protein JSU63_07935 [Phycisphaerales bacterium]|nr:MAG: hypothetical protein JSU63_07935 [Phycisphaerales bacterium]